MVNKDGRLFKLAADGSSDLLEIQTGAITQCNNDHVVTADGPEFSPDGKTIWFNSVRTGRCK